MMLTERQREIASMVAKGMSATQIAHHTGLAVPTVQTHITAAASRLPGDTKPRHKLTLWFISLNPDESPA